MSEASFRWEAGESRSSVCGEDHAAAVLRRTDSSNTASMLRTISDRGSGSAIPRDRDQPAGTGTSPPQSYRNAVTTQTGLQLGGKRMASRSHVGCLVNFPDKVQDRGGDFSPPARGPPPAGNSASRQNSLPPVARSSRRARSPRRRAGKRGPRPAPAECRFPQACKRLLLLVRGG